MAARTCEHCEGPMPVLARAHARFCSGRCRTAAHRARRTLPTELTSRDRWVRRTARKVPLTTDGKRAASSTNPATWASYRDAVKSKVGAGLGFVLDGDGIVCLDLDHCLTGGHVAPWAQRILDQLPATYVEVSPSGDGLHVWGRARVQRGRKVRLPGGGQVEVYGWGRYITVTRDRFAGAPARLADLSEVVATLT